MPKTRKVIVVKIDEIYGKVIAPDWNIMEGLYKKFSIWVENAKFDKRVKAGLWDGKIHFVQKNGLFQLGLLKNVLDFLYAQKDYKIILDPKLKPPKINKADFKEEFINLTSETLDCPFNPRYYQLRGAVKSLYYKRAICEHCTGAGKSLSIALVCNYLMNQEKKHKVLILVPRRDLIEQLTEDFIEYGLPPDMLGKYVGYKKDTDQEIIIATWQSMINNLELVNEFTALIADECLDPNVNITMFDGSYKKIKNINIGDIVKTKNELTGEIENKPVKYIHHNLSYNEDMYEIEMENGQKIKITGNHKVLTTKGKWIKVEDLTINDDLEVHSSKVIMQ